MNETKYLDENGLLYYDQKAKGRLEKKVDKEFKTGSESQYKVLSDNNLTDELVQKINEAGTSQFDGKYNSLEGIPTLDGKEIKGTLTSEDLGLAKTTDIPTDYVSNTELEEKGYQTAADVNNILDDKQYATETFVTSKGYQTASQVNSAVTTATKDMATQTYVKQQLANYNKKEVVTSTDEMTDENIIYLLANKGSGNNIYDEYIVYDGTPEKIGTTEVDLSNYLKKTDLVAITNAEIDGLFSA